MGLNEETVEFVGAFLGMRSETARGVSHTSSQFEDMPIGQSGTYAVGGGRQYFRAQQESEIIRGMILRGNLLNLRLYSYSEGQKISGAFPNDKADQGLYINVKGYIHHFQRFMEKDDRVWYQILFRITEYPVLSSPTTKPATSDVAVKRNVAKQVELIQKSGKKTPQATDPKHKDPFQKTETTKNPPKGKSVRKSGIKQKQSDADRIKMMYDAVKKAGKKSIIPPDMVPKTIPKVKPGSPTKVKVPNREFPDGNGG